jgi:hypothetical protein
VLSPQEKRLSIPLLELVDNDPLPGQVQPPPPPVIVDNQEEWEVEEILDSRLFGRVLKYHVRWLGFDHPTWEPSSNLKHAMDNLSSVSPRDVT